MANIYTKRAILGVNTLINRLHMYQNHIRGELISFISWNTKAYNWLGLSCIAFNSDLEMLFRIAAYSKSLCSSGSQDPIGSSDLDQSFAYDFSLECLTDLTKVYDISSDAHGADEVIVCKINSFRI
jgi:hypothetical protein